MSQNNTATLEGRIERITFHNPETHYMVARLGIEGQSQPVTIVGHLPQPKPGETLRVAGVWKDHPKYGAQFQVTGFELLLPAAVDDIRKYLSSGLIAGIGPKTAERLIRHFQGDTLTVIESQPQRLAEVRGIGPETAQKISTAWQQHHAVRELMRFLQDIQVQPSHGARIYKLYGADALEILKSDPYRLAADMPRSGFYIADAIVQQSDLPFDERDRATACLRFLLEESFQEGHMYLPRDELLERAGTTFNLDFHGLETALDLLQDEELLVAVNDAPQKPVYLKPLYLAEKEIARRVQARLSLSDAIPEMDEQRIMATVVKRLAIQLSEAQVAVLKSVLSQRMVIVTGGPGTGKTTLIRAIAAVFDAVGKRFLMAAPTGRAARRMAEVTGRKAATLHKLLGFNFSENQFERDQDDPLDTEALIVDEASMVDALLMGSLIKALPLQASLILVGDVFQLPSVGPGTVLADMIRTGMIQTFELNEVFRQEAQSPIIAGAHAVRRGVLPEMSPVTREGPLTPFTFIECPDPRQTARIIVSLCKDQVPRQMNIDAIRDLQVVTPMHKGPVGTLQLNQMLQTALNARAMDDKGFNGRFHINDKVMHLRNNYQKEVFNGEIGTVCAMDRASGKLCAEFDGRQVDYDESDIDELSLAYAISVHKSQGSEYPVVILPLVTQHYIMLQRNLLYTALTRARQMVIMVGNPKAVRIAVEADQPRQRRSLLAWWMAGEHDDAF